jgi:hypothetical protein
MPSVLSETRHRSDAYRSIEIGACSEPASGEYLLLRELMHRMNNELAATTASKRSRPAPRFRSPSVSSMFTATSFSSTAWAERRSSRSR